MQSNVRILSEHPDMRGRAASMLTFKTGWGVIWHAREDGKAEVTVSDPVGDIVPLRAPVVDAEGLARIIAWANDLSSTYRVGDVS